jgi:hypothetical protein
VSQAQLTVDLLDWIVVIDFWASLLFPVVVGLFWKWWRADAASFGKSMMVLELLIAFSTAPAALRRMFGIPIASIGYMWFLIAALGAIAPAIAWRTWSLWRIQSAPAPDQPRGPPPEQDLAEEPGRLP